MIKSSRALETKMDKSLKAAGKKTKGINSVWAKQGLEIVKAYIDELYELFSRKGFENDAAEIEFFKDIFPRFLGRYIYFFRLVKIAAYYEKLTASKHLYLKEQDDQYSIFMEERTELHDSLLSGDPVLERAHFLRKNGKMTPIHEYELVMDPNKCTSGSLLLSEMRGYGELQVDLRREMQRY